MDISTLDSQEIKTLSDKEYPFYDSVEGNKKQELPKTDTSNQFPDSDTVDNLQTSRAEHPAPNTLVPLDSTGKFPASVIPTSSADASKLSSQNGTGSFTFVLPAVRASYIFTYRVFITGGSNSASAPISCVLNSDSTAGNYHLCNLTWQNGAYNLNGAPPAGEIMLAEFGTNPMQTSDFAHGHVTIHTDPTNSKLYWVGTAGATHAGVYLSQQFDAVYKASSGPWTVVGAAKSSLTWQYDIRVYALA